MSKDDDKRVCVCIYIVVALLLQESRGVSDEDEVRSLVDDAKEAAEVLRNLVVQSQIDEAGNLSTFIRALSVSGHPASHPRDYSLTRQMRMNDPELTVNTPLSRKPASLSMNVYVCVCVCGSLRQSSRRARSIPT